MTTLPLHKHLLAMSIGGLLAHIACRILIALDNRRTPETTQSSLVQVWDVNERQYRRLYGADSPGLN